MEEIQAKFEKWQEPPPVKQVRNNIVWLCLAFEMFNLCMDYLFDLFN